MSKRDFAHNERSSFFSLGFQSMFVEIQNRKIWPCDGNDIHVRHFPVRVLSLSEGLSAVGWLHQCKMSTYVKFDNGTVFGRASK